MLSVKTECNTPGAQGGQNTYIRSPGVLYLHPKALVFAQKPKALLLIKRWPSLTQLPPTLFPG